MIDRYLTDELAAGLVAIPDAARGMQTMLAGPRGVGKSMLLGLMAFTDFLRRIPTVFIDPHGAGISHFLGRVVELAAEMPHDDQYEIFERIVYIDMGSPDYIIPFPLYYNTGQDSLQRQAMRLPQVFLRLDPHLYTASRQGANSLIRIGRAAGMCARRPRPPSPGS